MKKVNSLCVMPWISLGVRNKGEVVPCMSFDFNDQVVCKSPHNELNHILETGFSNLLTDIKNKMLKNEYVDGCSQCMRNENFSLKSYVNDRHKDELQKIKNNNSILPLKYLSLGLGNKCNLACLSCGEQGSDTWSLYHLGHKSRPFPYDYYDIFKNLNYSHLKNLEEILISGGEPLLYDELAMFFEHLSHINNNLRVRIFTNGTIKLSSPLSKSLENFKSVTFHLSIDHIAEKNNALRYPSRWESIEQNLSSFSKFEINIYCTLSLLNIYYIDSFICWYNGLNFNIKSISFNLIFFPKILSPMYIQDSYKKVLRDKYLKTEELNQYGNLYPLMQSIVNSPKVSQAEYAELKKIRTLRFKKYREVTGQNLIEVFREAMIFNL